MDALPTEQKIGASIPENLSVISNEKKQYPTVQLQIDNRRKVVNNRADSKETILNFNSEPVGFLLLEYHFDHPIGNDIVNSDQSFSDTPSYVTLSGIRINKDLEGRGYGRATYNAILERMGETPFLADIDNHNKASTGVWKSLVRDGLAREVHRRAADGSTSVMGYISIPTSQRSAEAADPPLTEEEFWQIQKFKRGQRVK